MRRTDAANIDGDRVSSRSEAAGDGHAMDREAQPGAELLASLMDAVPARLPGVESGPGLVIGELVGIAEDGHVPLVRYARQPAFAALPARSVVDLQGAHIGRQVVLGFEGNDPARPIVMGLLRDDRPSVLPGDREHVEVESDGERLIVSARDQVVLRCGKASITLTKAGKVLIEGTYVASCSSSVNRIRGGSVEIN